MAPLHKNKNRTFANRTNYDIIPIGATVLRSGSGEESSSPKRFQVCALFLCRGGFMANFSVFKRSHIIVFISLVLSQKIDKALLGDIKGMPILTNQARLVQMHWILTNRTSKKAFFLSSNIHSIKSVMSLAFGAFLKLWIYYKVKRNKKVVTFLLLWHC